MISTKVNKSNFQLLPFGETGEGLPILFMRLEKGFGEWLATLGYSGETVYRYPMLLREFLSHLSAHNVYELKAINNTVVREFVEYFKRRPNIKTGEPLSIAHINKQLDSLNKFREYISSTQNINIYNQQPYLKTEYKKQRVVLSVDEVNQLYEACNNNLYGLRDKAMLAVFYGCAIRKKEAFRLDVSDVLFDRKLLYIRHPKNSEERYVPLNEKSLKILEEYIFEVRPLLVSDGASNEFNHELQDDALFINQSGYRMSGEGLAKRLKTLKNKAGNTRQFGLHALRHSIATHLMHAGMNIENLALFLGHKCLDSTQVYTHLAKEIQ